jgi:hypothetical protein
VTLAGLPTELDGRPFTGASLGLSPVRAPYGPW